MSRNGSSRDLLRIALSTNARAEPSAGVTGNGGTSRKAAGKGSRKNSRAPSRMHSREASSSDEDEWDDTSSLVSEVESWSLDIDSFDDENVVSSGPAMLHTTNSAQEQASKIMEALETLSEKRTSTRLTALGVIINILAHNYLAEELEGNKVSILDAFKQCLKKPKQEKEAVLALKGIAIWFVTFGEEQSAYDEMRSVLEPLIASTKSNAIRSQAINALAVSNFVAAEDHRDTVQVIEQIRDLLCAKKQSERNDPATFASGPMVIQQMLTSLGFLMTLIAQTHPSLVGDLFKPSIDKHLALLGTDSFGIRMTAAQNIAFVYDVMTRINPRFEFAKHDQLISTLHLMIREGAKRVKHKERKHQRGIIRDVLNTIEEGDPPSLKLKFKNQIITFGDWTQILRLYAFRDTLSTGFHAHFMDNPLLPAIFNVDIGSAGSGSIQPNVTERVVVDPGSELAKARTKVMQSRRDKRRVARDIIDPLHDDEY